ncbi:MULTISPECIES: class I SAM-dependent methyltransferase [unclassified Oceanispirochaeta]|uniref:class I SAM-dependent methyltransferase n=1 Tax=unclassified Oceanispirochaeta TaxID=2635722 RepID=UPI000E09DA74|nr:MULTISPECIES: class I SAM-dependent methyltransferase [unclassified Oceanispirochaeta]MBF9017323.1 class I SAM-dependent methyltransferase [Oceanispirochaeta sp. M2]NPD73833.1 class I SAM-dependent methyltransferase [Oceanispirochaeta sp. M1]RDG30433.1 class I SAM-dependent methyltransferase [Oceanispirochaeta sp. M1]
MADAKKFWNRIAENYAKQDDSGNDQDYKLTIERTIKYLNREDVLLDFACGPGTASIELAAYVNNVSAIDISEKMIEIASHKAQDKNITNVGFTVSELFDSKLIDESFNVITGFNILHLIEGIDDSLNRIHGLLKPGGQFISVTDSGKGSGRLASMFFHILSKTGIIPFYRQYSLEELRGRMESCGFSIIICDNLHESSTNSFIVAKKDNP